MSDLILYTTEDGRSQIKLRAKDQTVWLTQLEMAELFDATKQNISLHLKNVFADGELDEVSVVKESLTTAADGKRYQTLLYNLDAILAVGYRVRSPRGVQFRRRPRRVPSISIMTSAAKPMKRRQPTTKTRLICKPWKTH